MTMAVCFSNTSWGVKRFSITLVMPKSLQALSLLLILSLNAGAVSAASSGPIGSCGGTNGGQGCPNSLCCSESNFCGSGSAYCGSGCQNGPCLPGFGPAGPDQPKCGTQAGNKKCDNNMCCSQYGFCGNSNSFCYSGCQSNCKLKPATIAGVGIGAVVGFAFLCLVAVHLFNKYGNHRRKSQSKQPGIQPVHRLVPPNAETPDENTCLDVVFCHGYAIAEFEKDAWKKTWSKRDNLEVCWAKDWLGDDLKGKARIFSLEYDAHVSADPYKRGCTDDVSEIAKFFLQSLFGDGYGIGQKNAVVLIGHSFGGLVIKSIVVEAQHITSTERPDNAVSRDRFKKCKNFLKNIKGIVFYAVPHSGAQKLKDYITERDNIYRKWKARLQNVVDSPHPLLSNIDEFSRHMEELSRKFDTFVRPKNQDDDSVIIYAFTEGCGLPQDPALNIIVPHGSAARFAGNDHFKIETANHMTVCRPYDKNDESYRRLLQVLNTIINMQEKQNSRSMHSFDVEQGIGTEGLKGSSKFSARKSLLRETFSSKTYSPPLH